MTYDYAIEKRDIQKIDKLNKLYNLKTYWDDVRKLTKNVTSTHMIHRWQCLAEVRFEEVKQWTLERYKVGVDLLRGEIGASTMDLVLAWIQGKGNLPRCDMGGSDMDSAHSLKWYYEALKQVGMI